MKNSQFSFLARFPIFEILLRLVYKNFLFRFSYLDTLKSKFFWSTDTYANKPLDLSDLRRSICSRGINEGDFLLVHSSMKQLHSFGVKPSELIKMFLDILGPSGTLVMPAFPKYSVNISLDLNSSDKNRIYTYDLRRSMPSTGILPFKLMRLPGAVRSSFPLNSLVAFGSRAHEMFSRELADDFESPCGINSAWNYCALHNCKILMLDVDLAHHLTMIHVAEDSFEDSWNIPNWYRDRSFNVIKDGYCSLVNVRERRPFWANFYAEKRLNHDLFSQNIASQIFCGSISLIFLESHHLIEFLSKKKRPYPYMIPFFLR